MRGVQLPWCFFALALGCGAPPPPPPTAVIDSTPDDVCAGDDYTTPVVLSGARSAGRLSLVPAPPEPDMPLRFDWRLEGDAHRVIAGALDAPSITVLVAGERPLHVTLEVTAFEGGRAETLRSIGITVPDAPPCDGGCAAGSECVEWQGESRCLPEGSCAMDEECVAPCFVCESGIGRCVPGWEQP